MAERRMFAKTIIDSDAFLEMPLSTQSLYFHLSMRADDDGFINNPKKIQRMVGASEDDLKLLIAKRFIIPFESGIVVIKHWKIHNYIRSDRYKETVYQEEKACLTVKDNGAYTLGIPSVNQVSYQMDTQVRLGKVSIDKESINKEFEQLWSLYPRKQGKKKAFDAYERARRKGTAFEDVESGIRSYLSYLKTNRIEQQFIKQGSTFFNQCAWLDDWSVKASPSHDGTEGRSYNYVDLEKKLLGGKK